MAKSQSINRRGLNPALVDCFFCGKEKSIALLAKGKGDNTTPKHILMDYEPCSDCEATMANGITFIECTDTPAYEGMPEIHRNTWPTGRWCVCNESVIDVIKDERMRDNIKKRRKCLVNADVFNALLKLRGGKNA